MRRARGYLHLPTGAPGKGVTEQAQRLGLPAAPRDPLPKAPQLTGSGTSGTSRRGGPGSRRCRSCRRTACSWWHCRDSAPPGLWVRIRQALPCCWGSLPRSLTQQSTHRPGEDQSGRPDTALPIPTPHRAVPTTQSSALKAPPAAYGRCHEPRSSWSSHPSFAPRGCCPERSHRAGTSLHTSSGCSLLLQHPQRDAAAALYAQRARCSAKAMLWTCIALLHTSSYLPCTSSSAGTCRSDWGIRCTRLHHTASTCLSRFAPYSAPPRRCLQKRGGQGERRRKKGFIRGCTAREGDVFAARAGSAARVVCWDVVLGCLRPSYLRGTSCNTNRCPGPGRSLPLSCLGPRDPPCPT